MVKCNYNNALFLSSSKVGYGVVVRGNESNLLAACSGLLNCVLYLGLAETLACKEALSWINNKSYRNVIVEFDCLNMCHYINSPS